MVHGSLNEQPERDEEALLWVPLPVELGRLASISALFPPQARARQIEVADRLALEVYLPAPRAEQ